MEEVLDFVIKPSSLIAYKIRSQFVERSAGRCNTCATALKYQQSCAERLRMIWEGRLFITAKHLSEVDKSLNHEQIFINR